MNLPCCEQITNNFSVKYETDFSNFQCLVSWAEDHSIHRLQGSQLLDITESSNPKYIGIRLNTKKVLAINQVNDMLETRIIILVFRIDSDY